MKVSWLFWYAFELQSALKSYDPENNVTSMLWPPSTCLTSLSDIVTSGDTESCGYTAGDLTGEGDVNLIDIIALASFIMEGTL